MENLALKENDCIAMRVDIYIYPVCVANEAVFVPCCVYERYLRSTPVRKFPTASALYPSWFLLKKHLLAFL